MQALLVVNFLQELSDRSFGFLQIAVFRAVDFLVFEGLDKTFRSGIVVRVRHPAHAATNAVLFQLCPVVLRSILHAPVGMVYQARLWPTLPQRDAQSLQYERRLQR